MSCFPALFFTSCEESGAVIYRSECVRTVLGDWQPESQPRDSACRIRNALMLPPVSRGGYPGGHHGVALEKKCFSSVHLIFVPLFPRLPFWSSCSGPWGPTGLASHRSGSLCASFSQYTVTLLPPTQTTAAASLSLLTKQSIKGGNALVATGVCL